MSSELQAAAAEGEQFQFSGFGPAHAGVLLAQAREARGLSIEELSAQLKIPPRKLEQLEAGQFGEIAGGAAYVRALCRAVCKALKTDEAAVLALMPASNPKALLPEADPGLGEPFANSERMGRLGVRASVRPQAADGTRNVWLWGAGAVLAAALAVLAWPSLRDRLPVLTRAAPAPRPVPVETQTAQTEAPAAAAATVSASAPAAAVALMPASSLSTALTAPINPAVLTIEADETSWIEVRNDDGVVLVSRNLMPGERIEQGLERRRNVTIGNAAATRVWLRGQLMDLQPYARDNVARFDVR
jgi:cytoskeleton protein RodZ